MNQLQWLLLSQLITLFGSTLTNFGLPIWIYQQTESATLLGQYAGMVLLSHTIVGPYAGSIIHHCSSRLCLILTGFLQLLCTIGMMLLVISADGEELYYYLIPLGFIGGLGGALHYPALKILMSLFVQQGEELRAQAGLETIKGLAWCLAPVVAGWLLFLWDFYFVLILDLLAALVGIGLFVMVSCKVESARASGAQGSIPEKMCGFAQLLKGFRLLLGDSQCVSRLVMSISVNTCFSIAVVFFVPLLLALGLDENIMGIMISSGAFCKIVAANLAGRIQPSKSLLFAVLWGTMILGVFGFCLIGLAPSMMILTVGYLLMMSLVPVLNIWNSSSWQQHPSRDLQHSFLAVERSLSHGLVLLGLAFAGPVLDHIITPNLGSDILAYKYSFIAWGLLLLAVSALGLLVPRFGSR